MSQAADEGICPTCEGTGRPGEACSTPRCHRAASHYIPRAYTPASGPSDPLIGQRWDGYLIVRKLGEGGIGAVYLALQQPVGLRTALKVLHGRAANSAMAERFISEATALARLVHPNIVRLLGAGSAHGRGYIAMEFIEGGQTLEAALARGVDLDAARRILLQMIDSLDSAHRVDVIHRDIKPANVMLQTTGREPYFVRIVDFGLVKFTDDGASTQLAAGTPAYMAPEQARQTDIGPWTDWYAVGVVACELFLGRRPFPRLPPHALLARKLTGQLDPLAELATLDPPEAMRTLLSRSLDPEPRARASTAAEMTELVERAHAALTGRAPPAGSVEPGGLSTTTDLTHGVVEDPASIGPVGLDPTRRRALGAAAALIGAAGIGWWVLDGLNPSPAPSARQSTGSTGPIGADARSPVTLDATPSEAPPDAVAASDGAPLDVALDAAPDAEPDAAPDAAARPSPPPRPSRRRRARRPAVQPSPPAPPDHLDIEEI